MKPAVSDSATGTTFSSPKNLAYKLLFISEKMIREKTICGGKIASTNMDCFCAKGLGCDSASHKNKHKAFASDTFFIFGKSSGGKAAERVLYPDQFSYKVYDTRTDSPFINPIKDEFDKIMRKCSSLEEAGEVFNKFVETIVNNKQMEGPWKEAIKKQDMEDEKLGISLGDLDLEDTKPSTVSFKPLVINTANTEGIKMGQDSMEGVEQDNIMLVVQQLMEQVNKLDSLVIQQLNEIEKGSEAVRKLQREVYDLSKDLELERKYSVSREWVKEQIEDNHKNNVEGNINHLLGRVGRMEMNDVDLLEEQVEKLEQSNTIRSGGFGEYPAGNVDNRPTEDYDNIKQSVNNLEFEVQLLSSRSGSEPIEFGGILLQSYADTLIFVEDHMPVSSFSCFFDFIALLDSLRDTRIDEKGFVEAEYNAQKTKLTVAEVAISASFLHLAPLCFCNSKSEDGNFGSIGRSLPLVKNRENWVSQGGAEGMKRMLDMEVINKVNGIQKEIFMTLQSSKGAQLAQSFLTESHACYMEFSNWTESFYHELIAMAHIDPKEAWMLILSCWLALKIFVRSG